MEGIAQLEALIQEETEPKTPQAEEYEEPTAEDYDLEKLKEASQEPITLTKQDCKHLADIFVELVDLLCVSLGSKLLKRRFFTREELNRLYAGEIDAQLKEKRGYFSRVVEEDLPLSDRQRKQLKKAIENYLDYLQIESLSPGWLLLLVLVLVLSDKAILIYTLRHDAE